MTYEVVIHGITHVLNWGDFKTLYHEVNDLMADDRKAVIQAAWADIVAVN
jgi:hypothetical protein